MGGLLGSSACAAHPAWTHAPTPTRIDGALCHPGLAEGLPDADRARAAARLAAARAAVLSTGEGASAEGLRAEARGAELAVWRGEAGGDAIALRLRDEAVIASDAVAYVDVDYPLYDARVRVCVDDASAEALARLSARAVEPSTAELDAALESFEGRLEAGDGKGALEALAKATALASDAASKEKLAAARSRFAKALSARAVGGGASILWSGRPLVGVDARCVAPEGCAAAGPTDAEGLLPIAGPVARVAVAGIELEVAPARARVRICGRGIDEVVAEAVTALSVAGFDAEAGDCEGAEVVLRLARPKTRCKKKGKVTRCRAAVGGKLSLAGRSSKLVAKTSETAADRADAEGGALDRAWIDLAAQLRGALSAD